MTAAPKEQRIAHDFKIDVMVRPRDNRTIFVARCIEPGCIWYTLELTTRCKAVIAAHWHQTTKIVEAL